MMVCPQCGKRYAAGAKICRVEGARLIKLSDDPYVGYQIDKYTLQRRIGKGGFGVVYLATHSELGSEVAIKILRKQFITDEQLVERFRREARVSTQINHENVVQILDFGYDTEIGFYFVMEYLDGTSLSDVMKAYPKGMPVDRILPIFRQICGALERAHSISVVHRDLKPSNILLIKRFEQQDVVKILDFGIAKVLQGDDSKGVTVTGQIVGSPRFMSPEQARGRHSDVDARSDIYSLGVMLFWMLTGRLPYESKQLARLLYMHVKAPVPSLASVRPDASYSPGLERVVRSALAKPKSERPASASAFFEGVEEACGGPDGAPRMGAAVSEPGAAGNVFTPVDKLEPSRNISMSSSAPRMAALRPVPSVQPDTPSGLSHSHASMAGQAPADYVPVYGEEDDGMDATVVETLPLQEVDHDLEQTLVVDHRTAQLPSEQGTAQLPAEPGTAQLPKGPPPVRRPPETDPSFDLAAMQELQTATEPGLATKPETRVKKPKPWWIGVLVGLLVVGLAFLGWHLGRRWKRAPQEQQKEGQVSPSKKRAWEVKARRGATGAGTPRKSAP